MVQFGQSLRQARRSGWEAAYLDYDKLKASLYSMETVLTEAEAPGGAFRDHEQTPLLLQSSGQPQALQQQEQQPPLERIVACGKAFSAELQAEIEKVTLFSLKQQGQLADAVGALRFCCDDQKDGKAPTMLFEKITSLSSPDKSPAEAYAVLGVELLHLLRFICINATGVRKILKKYEKLAHQVIHALVTAQSQGNDDEDDWMEMTALQQLKYSHLEPSGKGGNDPTNIATPRLGHKRAGSSRDVVPRESASDDHLRELVNSASVAAIQASLSLALQEQLERQEHPTLTTRNNNDDDGLDPSLLRFQFVMASIETLRQHAEVVTWPFSNFLSRKAMIATGSNMVGLEIAPAEALRRLLRFEPDTILYLPKDELVDWYRMSGAGGEDDQMLAAVVLEVPVRKRHKRSASHFEMMQTMSAEEVGEERRGDKAWGGVDTVSLVINLLSTLLYTVNYYIVVPNANYYAILLGQDGAYGATLIGASSFAALFAAFVYSFWYTKSSFKSALIFSSVCPMLGNLFYSIAISYRSMPLALWGRILCGFGSAEVVNRQLISACVSFERLTRASAYFVAVGAAGMSIGPLLGSVFDMLAGRDEKLDVSLPFMPSGGIIYNHVTGPGFFMAVLWLLQMLALVLFFHEPGRVNIGESSRHKMFDVANERSSGSSRQNRSKAEADYSSFLQLTEPSECTASVELRSDTKGSNKIWSMCRSVASEISLTMHLIFENPGLPVTLLLFCYIEMADEVLISSCSMVGRRYLGWHGSTSGLVIASLGALVLPADFVVERASHYFSERKMMKYAVLFIILTLFGIMNYEGLFYDMFGYSAELVEDHTKETDITISGMAVGQILNKQQEFPYNWNAGVVVYTVFLSATFMGTIMLEGVVTSLMAKVTPAKLNDAFINSGLLATLIGTLGRVFADLLITMSALLDVYVFVDFVNATFVPLLLLACLGYYLVKRNYKQFMIN